MHSNLNRRTVLAGVAATIPAATLPTVAFAAAVESDPIFAAIERVRRAHDAL